MPTSKNILTKEEEIERLKTVQKIMGAQIKKLEKMLGRDTKKKRLDEVQNYLDLNREQILKNVKI